MLARPDACLWAVADGMGGHAAGEVASGLAIQTLERGLDELPAPARGAADWLRRSFSAANAVIRAHGKAVAETRGMGTTLTAIVCPNGNGCVIAHIGDSRAYRLRASMLERLTRDHTWVQERIDAGLLSPKQAADHPFSSVLTRVLGMDATAAPDLLDADAKPGDTFLLCSDGLTGMVAEGEIAQILDRDEPLPVLAETLVDTAKRAGGLDNISLVILRARP